MGFKRVIVFLVFVFLIIVFAFFSNNSSNSSLTGNIIELKECPFNEKIISEVGNLINNGKKVILKEGDKVFRNQYFLIEGVDGGKIFQVMKIYDSELINGIDEVEVFDYILGDKRELDIDSPGVTSLTVSGKKYIIKYYDNKSLKTDEYLTIDNPDTSETQIKIFNCNWNNPSANNVKETSQEDSSEIEVNGEASEVDSLETETNAEPEEPENELKGFEKFIAWLKNLFS